MHDLAVSWSEEGPKVLARVAKENPSGYFSVCARLLPSDVSITLQAQTPILDADDLAILKAIKAGIPGASERTPQAVLQFTLDAIRAHGSQLIDAPALDRDC
jgi:hypothetical protein